VKTKLLIVGILLAGFFVRGLGLNHGLSHACLTPPDEFWLYNPYQTPSLYVTTSSPINRLDIERPLGNPNRVIANQTQDLWVLRYLGILQGVVVLALTVVIGRRLQVRWVFLASMGIAVAWWFVASDQWVLRYDGALLLVAIATTILVHYRQQPPSWACWLYDMCAVGLWLVAPPLWWLGVILGLIAPKRDMPRIVFLALSLIVLFPSMRQAYQWMEGAFTWDISLTATLIWLLLVLGMWAVRVLPNGARWLAWGAIGILTIVTLTQQVSYPQPTENDWVWIGAVQDQIADDTWVEFDKATWHLANVVACPLKTNIHMHARGYGSLLSTHALDYQVTTTQPTDATHHVTDVGNGVFLVRYKPLPNALNKLFGDQIRLLGYQLSTNTLTSEQPLDIRMDWQLTSTVTEQITVYAGFVHVTLPNQPAEKVYETAFPLVDVLGEIAPRANRFSRHFWLSLPSRVPAGTYDIVLGLFHTIEGREVGRITLGQVTIVP
jgi:hypothetical protein